MTSPTLLVRPVADVYSRWAPGNKGGESETVAARHGATPAQVALAWLLAQPGIAAPIASATTTVQLAEILKSAELRLTVDDLAGLAKASA